jgi:hypothetical protein
MLLQRFVKRVEQDLSKTQRVKNAVKLLSENPFQRNTPAKSVKARWVTLFRKKRIS